MTSLRTEPTISLLRPETANGLTRFLGFGAAQPSTATTGAELGAAFSRSADWIESRTGIREVRRLGEGEQFLDMAARAAADAIFCAALPPEEIDLVIGATCSQRIGATPLSAHVASRLAPRAAFFDLNAACSGFCYATALADSLIQNGSAQNVLIVAAEHMSSMLDPADLGTNIIFGDGAGAAVIARNLDGHEIQVGPVAWGSDGGQSELISFGDGEFLGMQGQSVFRWAVDEVHHVARDACAKAGIALSDIEVFVPHQANLRIVTALAAKLGLEKAVVSRDIATSGNTSAASIPIAVTRLLQSGAADLSSSKPPAGLV